ncbi:unnamed protein product [Calypogeia fissa]
MAPQRIFLPLLVFLFSTLFEIMGVPRANGADIPFFLPTNREEQYFDSAQSVGTALCLHFAICALCLAGRPPLYTLPGRVRQVTPPVAQSLKTLTLTSPSRFHPSLTGGLKRVPSKKGKVMRQERQTGSTQPGWATVEEMMGQPNENGPRCTSMSLPLFAPSQVGFQCLALLP